MFNFIGIFRNVQEDIPACMLPWNESIERILGFNEASELSAAFNL